METPTTIRTAGCGSCSLCCKLLHIDAVPELSFEEKSWNTWCTHCEPGGEKPCQRYETRPQACKTFECIFLQSWKRQDIRPLPEKLRPSNCHVVMVPSMEADLVLFAYVDPIYPKAWREEPIRSHLITVSNLGATVVIVVDDIRYLMTRGRPTIRLTADQVAQLADGRLMKVDDANRIQMSKGWAKDFTPENPRPLPGMREVGIEQHLRSLLEGKQAEAIKPGDDDNRDQPQSPSPLPPNGEFKQK